MRVLILNQYALPAGEAGITRHGELGAELVRRGHEVTVIASDFDYFTRQNAGRTQSTSATHHDGVRFLWLKTGAYVGNGRRRMMSMARYAIAATRSGVRHSPPPDVVIGSSPQPLAPLAAHIVARVRKTPWVFEARDIWPSALVDLGAIQRNGLTHRTLERLERYLYARADAIVSVPPRGALRLEELGLDTTRCTHIPNAATTLLSEPAALPEVLDTWSQGRQGLFVLVYTGAIGVPHDFGTVVRAISHLKEKNRDVYEKLTVLVVGGGVAAESTRRAAQEMHLDRLVVHDAISKGAVRTLLMRADACLMQAAASDHFRYGLSPNKLFDYFGAAKPVLISSALPTLVDEAGAGIRYAPGDPAALAKAIVTIVGTPAEERKAMGERGERLIASHSVGAITDQFESLLQRVVTDRRRAVSSHH